MDVDTLKISLITCTYNPNIEIFKRLIVAVANLNTQEVSVEWIVVDNNSAKAVEEQFDFTLLSMPVLHVLEIKPGLTQARMAGSKVAKGDWLIFFDDDNEPSDDFIVQLNNGINKYPEVNCWGPGRIEVDYIGNVNRWFKEHKSYFQDRAEDTKFGNIKGMQPYYPIGTGLCIKVDAMWDYIAKVENNSYNVADRTSKSLVSGGDTQIVLNNQNNGNYAGKLKNLKLKHLIEARKANFAYLRKQNYWTSSSYLVVLKQVYNDLEVKHDETQNFSLKDVIWLLKIYYHAVKVEKKDRHESYLKVCRSLGEYNARYMVGYGYNNKLFNIVERLIVR
jgi:glycosyltransferase involved in cell wall biosynthesis